MADWQRHLRLKPEWEMARRGEITIAALAKIAADRLEHLSPFHNDAINEKRDDIVFDFRELAETPDAAADEFDDIMERLYDWADTRLDDKALGGKKVCWVDR